MMRLIMILTFAIGCYSQANAQQSDSTVSYKHVTDLYRISNKIQKISGARMKFTYRFSLSDAPATVLDSMIGVYHFEHGMIRGMLGENELLKNNAYSLSIDREDSVIILNKSSKAGADMFQINLFDSLFQAANIAGVERETDAAGNMTLTVIFKPASFYKSYSISYTKDYDLKKIHMEVPDLDTDENGMPPPAGRLKIVEVLVEDAIPEPYDLANFSEQNFIIRDEYGNWKGTDVFANFQVINTQPTN